MLHKAFISLGSNLHNPLKQIEQALAALCHLPQTKLLNYSSLYRTPALTPRENPQPQPDYINAAAELSTNLSPYQLLLALQQIEYSQQRQRIYRWGPRTLDLDLLIYAQAIINTPELTLPHPHIAERLFVLEPLCEINPDLDIPGLGKVSNLLQALLKKQAIAHD